MGSNNVTNPSMYILSLYNIMVFGEDELKRINLLAGILIGISPIIHLIIVSGTDVPYGRFTSSAWGIPVNAKVAWFLQVRLRRILNQKYNLFDNTVRINLQAEP